MAGELGKASLDLEANLSPFERNMLAAEKRSDQFQHALDALVRVAEICASALGDVKITERQAAETKVSAEGILSGVRGISDEARTAARELDRVRITEAQAAESDAAGDRIERNLSGINRQANETRRSIERVRLAGGRNGAGVGIFGSGFGRIGALGTAIGAGILTAPAAAPAAAGLLASIPTLAAGGVGVLGTLALALDGVGKAISGDKKAFDDLSPSAQRFVQTVRSLDGWIDKLKETAGEGLFPGLTQGLMSALTPGTVGAITSAVSELAKALGQAGAAWGKYFGSREFQSIFGPLMAAAAKNIGTLSSAALHLFDALGVLGRAAIPFTDWLMRAIDNGAKLADSWLHAKDASGALSRGMDEAKSSLRLVGGLAKALLDVVFALGKALYPVAKIAVKDLTDGLEALARIITRNQRSIREIVGGALTAFVGLVKTAAAVVRALWPWVNNVKDALGGWAHVFEILIGLKIASLVAGWAGSFKKLAGAEAIGGAETASAGLLTNLTKLKNLGPIAIGITIGLSLKGPIKQLFEKLGADFSPLTPDVPTAPTVVSKLHLTAPKGTSLAADLARIQAGKQLTKGEITDVINAFKRGDLTSGNTPTKSQIQTLINDLQHPGRGLPKRAPSTSTGTSASSSASSSSVFGTPPPFTKNTGSSASSAGAIPPAASHAEQLASANASRASVLGNVGAAAKRYLETELADLQTAAKLIKAKYETATGKARTQLFAALTSVENKMRTVRERIGKAIKDGRASELQFAVDQAKEAVAAATVGSAAYDKAVKAEEKALKAQIAYFAARAKNSKLSLAERTKALRIETADEKELKQLLKPSATVAAGANEAQFLSSFAEIAKQFAPNAFPQQPSGGKTDTHLYDMKTELRQQTGILDDINRKSSFPATGMSFGAAMAV